MRGFDISSWHGIVTSIAGLLLVTLIGMGIRLVMMMTLQQRRERQNRQINERLKALIAAYKTLGGSFTGTLTVDPAHRRDLKQALGPAAPATDTGTTPDAAPAEDHAPATEPGEARDPLQRSDRARRIRDAVEAALSDVVLFGTPAQVGLAAAAMRDMAAGRPVHVSELVVSLRGYVREVLDLGPVPPGVTIPRQGPARPSGASGSGKGQRDTGGGRGGGGGGMGGMGGGMAMGAGLGLSAASPDETDPPAGR